MPSCRLIVCEKTSHWAAALRAAMGTKQPQVVETRSVPGCEAALAESPASLVAIETTLANIESVLGLMARIADQFPRASVVVLLTAETHGAAPLMPEAGAIDAIVSVLQAPRVARLACRQFALAPKQEANFQEFVAELMPWAAYATADS